MGYLILDNLFKLFLNFSPYCFRICRPFLWDVLFYLFVQRHGESFSPVARTWLRQRLALPSKPVFSKKQSSLLFLNTLRLPVILVLIKTAESSSVVFIRLAAPRGVGFTWCDLWDSLLRISTSKKYTKRFMENEGTKRSEACPVANAKRCGTGVHQAFHGKRRK